jgi:peptidase inhibitor family I36
MDASTRTKRRAVAAAAATAAIGSAAGSALAEPAIAAHPSATCPSNTLCEWANPNFTGPVKWWPIYPIRDDNYADNVYDSNRSVRLDNSVSSIWNNTAYGVYACNHPRCSTGGPADNEYALCLRPDKAISDMGVNSTGWNNALSAHRIDSSIDPNKCNTYAEQEGCSL